MEFRILGPLEVLGDGRQAVLGGSRQRALLALLVIHANETLATERLIDEVWGERPPASAAKTLQVQISRLRKTLGATGPDRDAGMLVTRGAGYELRVDPDRIDSRRFEKLVGDGRRQLAARRPDLALSALEPALSLWRGPPLAEFAYERFAQAEVARLEELRVGALEELIDAKLALGRHAEVVGDLERLIREHPYRERLRSQLMLAFYRCERQADALQAYQDARRTLVEQLGIEPGQRLRELEQAILAQDQNLAVPDHVHVAAVIESAPEVPGSVFVGREIELAELIGGLDDAFARQGRLFLLIGEPGVGKSGLAEELARHARRQGARLLIGRCWEAGGAPAFWPWVQSLRSYVRASNHIDLVGQLGAGASDIATMLPELFELIPGLPQAAAPESQGGRFRLFHATAEFLRRASEQRPLVLILDDLHAADTPSLLMLQFIARELGSMRVLVVAAIRDVDPNPGVPLIAMLAEVAREPVTRRVTLSGLSEREVADYLQLTAADIASAELAAELYAETEGNPLFVTEAVRLLVLEGVRPKPERELRLVLPQSVRDVISRRLAHLSSECGQILVLASVLGREFHLEQLAGVAGVTSDALLETLDEAMAARVIGEVPGVAGQLRFAHVVIRDTLYEGLTTARRVRLHRLAAETLEALYAGDPSAHLAELAHHAIAGSDFEKAYAYARRAGERELTRFAFEEAARLYQTALDALELVDPAAETDRCHLLLSLAEAQARAGNTPAAQAASLEAAGIARHLGMGLELARAATCYGGRFAWERAGGHTQLVSLLEEGLRAVGEHDIELRSRLLARLAGALRDEHSRDRRDKLSREAVDLARRSGNRDALAFAVDGRIGAVIAPDTITECLALSSELHQVTTEIADREGLVQAHLGRIMAQVLAGDIHAAEVDLDRMDRIANELRQPAQLWMGCSIRAPLALAAGKLSEAEQENERALAIGERALPDMALVAHRAIRCALYDARGMLEEAESAIRELPAQFPERPVFRCMLAYIHAKLGRKAQAQEALNELAKPGALPFDLEWLYAMSLIAETCTRLQDTTTAAVLYRRLTAHADLNAADPPEGARGSVARYLGQLAAALGRHQEAADHFDRAVAMNRQMGAQLWLAHTQHDYAQLLLTGRAPGERKRGSLLHDAAQATYRELGIRLPSSDLKPEAVISRRRVVD
jgi:DNA-binding SARP family transcriptional activator